MRFVRRVGIIQFLRAILRPVLERVPEGKGGAQIAKGKRMPGEHEQVTPPVPLSTIFNAAQTAREMPRYKCHKEVWALKIASVDRDDTGRGWLGFDDAGFANMEMSPEFMRKHDPEPGGYYVQYADGYKSYSPAKAFEEGYARIR